MSTKVIIVDTEIENSHTGVTHFLKLEATIEHGVDSEAWGSTYVPRPWASIEEELWTWDGEEKADWFIEHQLRWLTGEQDVKHYKQALRDKALENIDG